MEQKTEEIYNKIVENLNIASTNNYFKTGNITDKIKLVIGEIGESLGFTVMANGNAGRFQSEWMYDMIWYTPNTSNEVEFERVEYFFLALESELSKFNLQGFREDFDKLLITYAPCKIMIFTEHDALSLSAKKYAEIAVRDNKHIPIGEKIALILYDHRQEGSFALNLITKV